MKLGNDSVKNKFDDINNKIDALIAFCQTLRSENQDLILQVKRLESDLEKKNQTEEKFSEKEAFIQSKIDALLTKLDSFTVSEETRSKV
ncbi:MAG: cell division protein ZapB [Desulfotignum sp.]|jgi:chromosome segregation ATPase|nr:cell division protein ZapB [Desulfotignum sp.]